MTQLECFCTSCKEVLVAAHVVPDMDVLRNLHYWRGAHNRPWKKQVVDILLKLWV